MRSGLGAWRAVRLGCSVVRPGWRRSGGSELGREVTSGERLRLGGRGGWWWIGSGGGDDLCAVGGGQGDAFSLEGKKDAAAEFAHDGVALVDHHPDAYGVDDLIAADFVDAKDAGLGDEDVVKGFIFAQSGGQFAEDGDDPVGIFAGVDGDVEGADGEVPGEVGDSGDLTVGDDVERAVAVAQAGDAEAEVFHGSSEAGDADAVSDGVLVLDEDEDAGEHVLEDGLGSEADAQPDDAGRGDEGAQRDAKGAENLSEEIEAGDAKGGGAQDGGDGAKLAGALIVGDKTVSTVVQTLDEQPHGPLEEEGQEQSEENLRNAVLDEVGEVELPTVLDTCKEALVVRERGGEVGDGSGEEQHWMIWSLGGFREVSKR